MWNRLFALRKMIYMIKNFIAERKAVRKRRGNQLWSIIAIGRKFRRQTLKKFNMNSGIDNWQAVKVNELKKEESWYEPE
jgi:hypothetical protein